MSTSSLSPEDLEENNGKKVSDETVSESESVEKVESSAENVVSEPQDIEDEIENAVEPQNIEDENVVEDKVTEASVEEKVVDKEQADIEEIDEIDDSILDLDEDFSNYGKKDFLALADKMLLAVKSREVSISDIKNIDNAFKVVRSAFDEMIQHEKSEAKEAYIAENGSDEGFEYRNDNHSIRFEGVLIQIKERKQEFYQRLEKEKEDNFETKTRLLQELREIVEIEEKGESKNNWEAFKNLQTAWKNAGNINSPHNGSLWSAYNALIDRYFDIKSIQNELKDLDRKKNIEAKEEVVVKIEEIATSLASNPISNAVLKHANELLVEYKQVGPGPREEQNALWERLKKAFDVIYDKKRELQNENSGLEEETFAAKSQMLTNLEVFLNFNSDSINEWNAKTKEVMAIQDQWNAIKGRMPRGKGKELSKNFWASLKQFFKNKSAFFAKLEAKREANLEQKSELVKQAKELLDSGDFSPANTNKIIDLQKKWKGIGHVPEKFKDSLYAEFKGVCDSFFDGKRGENKAQDSEYAKNLADKIAICEEIEKQSKTGEVELTKLADFKKRFAAIGFVPRKDMKSIQERFIKAINEFVRTSTGINKSEKDKLMLQNEAEVVLKSGGNLNRAENDLRRKIKTLEDEISLTKNNLEFFGYSKGADKMKEQYLVKIKKAEAELDDLNSKLRLIIAAN